MPPAVRFLVPLMVAVAAAPAQPPQPVAPNGPAIAELIVRRMALAPGERVLLVALPGAADSIVPLLRGAIRKAGGTDLGVIPARGDAPAAWATDFTRQARGLTGSAYDSHLAGADISVILPGAVVADPPYSALQRVLRTARGGGRVIHFHWAGAYAPDNTLAATTPEVARIYGRVLLDTDYDALARRQQTFERAMRGRTVRVTTPAGTDIRFEIGDRPVTRQDGDASAARARQARNLIDREVELPAGAIRVAPIEESVVGRIAFPPSIWGGERAEGLVMTFERGRVTRVEATSGRAGVERELAQAGDGARSFRELALGMNPLLAIPREGTPWIPYYGYGAGVVRLSLGDNTELGGNVGGGWVRWNFFTDATVTVGDEVWVRDGRMLR